MNLNGFKQRICPTSIMVLLFASCAFAQEKKVAITSKELFNEIFHMDSVLFRAYNSQNLEIFRSLFTDDVEWFQDNAGLIPYKTLFENVESNFKKENKLTRTLVNGSLDIHPIKDYGAIEIGSHQFRHFENGREEIGTFKFVLIWKKIDSLWKISRVISYDH